jgi:hypothetical protein
MPGYGEGWAAFDSGLNALDCPYDYNTEVGEVMGDNWHMGLADARQARMRANVQNVVAGMRGRN